MCLPMSHVVCGGIMQARMAGERSAHRDIHRASSAVLAQYWHAVLAHGACAVLSGLRGRRHLTGISLASHCFSLHLTASHCISLTSTAMGGSMSGASVMLILVKSISMTVFALQSWVQRARAR